MSRTPAQKRSSERVGNIDSHEGRGAGKSTTPGGREKHAYFLRRTSPRERIPARQLVKDNSAADRVKSRTNLPDRNCSKTTQAFIKSGFFLSLARGLPRQVKG